MSAPGSTMKTIHKRLYTVLPRTRVRSNSATSTLASLSSLSLSSASSSTSSHASSAPSSPPSSRTLYTSAPGQPSPSPLAFFDSPPPPGTTPRGSARLPSEGGPKSELPATYATQHNSNSSSHHNQTHHTHANANAHPSLALTAPHTQSSGSANANATYPAPFSAYGSTAGSAGAREPVGAQDADAESSAEAHPGARTRRTPRTRYRLDVGAYGIPKRSRIRKAGRTGGKTGDSDELGLAVQVGEDAYFVRDDAMGVADGVGGWSRLMAKDAISRGEPSASALFARRLMHYCSAEVDAASYTSSSSTGKKTRFASGPSSAISPSSPIAIPHRQRPPPPRAPSSFFNPTPRRIFDIRQDQATSASAPTTPYLFEHWGANTHICEQEALDDEAEEVRADEEGERAAVEEEDPDVDELQEGLDVLMILERAYESALKAHVVPKEKAAVYASPAAAQGGREETARKASEYPPVPYPPRRPIEIEMERGPLRAACASATGSGETVPLMQGSATALVAVLDACPPSVSSSSSSAASPESDPDVLQAEPRLEERPREERQGEEEESGALLRIAHLGDSVGLLVRGGEVVWRSDEMWTSFNTPYQLGPASAHRPGDARVESVRVRRDDVLVLASDGLSDNLWDWEVMEEVRRVRAAFMPESGGEQNKKEGGLGSVRGVIGRKTMAGMLSEALCERARRVSERRTAKGEVGLGAEVPFAKRAREAGKVFRGGKADDISVCVAVISDST
ncbi:hypothetical protein PUNSTDRAFT_55722 [Punctularia strigosozonata HHB-11173 SS5]|uniref:Protein phosphatase n=1 Tax=Punctularia strigosozonata (strain HHB-11173) TaxID=741275 RepID=R7S1M7_PUNST|nr:uncharacterized protein PUNSTDRAFT_55722 [Punctularia strigosozonata HHB-11173 SS5]EIN04133.1 hypothetical protein PUNSTDRAFT_55722 [Punctularia strigosozonata HHB-11173 SS5]